MQTILGTFSIPFSRLTDSYLPSHNPTPCLEQKKVQSCRGHFAKRNILFYINSAESFSQTGSSACVLAKCLVLAQVRREFLSCSTSPHLLAPNLLLSHSFPQFSSLRARFINLLSTWLPATLLCHTLSPPLWSGARKSIEPLIAVSSSSSSSSVAQLLTQQIDVPDQPWLGGRTTQDI